MSYNKDYLPLHYKDARDMVAWAKRNGLLVDLAKIKTRCADCGDRAIQYDHRDYNKPLVVDPVCQSCNLRRGPGKPINREANHASNMKRAKHSAVIVYNNKLHVEALARKKQILDLINVKKCRPSHVARQMGISRQRLCQILDT